MAKKLTTKKCIITRQEGLIYSSPAHIPRIELCNINGSIEVRIKGESTSFTFDKTIMSDSIYIMTSTTSLRSISWIDIDNSTTFPQSFVFDKTLELCESPFMNPFVIISTASNSRQILHNNNISLIQTVNDSLTDIMISPLHQPCPASTQLFKFSFGSSCAYTLEFTNENIMFDSLLLDFLSVEPPFICNSESIDSHVNAENSLCVRANDTNTGECEQEESPVEFVNYQKALGNFPIVKVLNKTVRDGERNFNPSFNSREAENIIFHGCGARKVIADGRIINNRFGLGFFNHPTSLFNTSNCELGLKSEYSQFLIDEWMEFNIISDFHFPSLVNAELQSCGIQFKSFNNFSFSFNLNLRRCSNTHTQIRNSQYINFLEVAILPMTQVIGIIAPFS